MYRVESDEYETRLVKIVDGQRTILSSVNYRMPVESWAEIRVRASGKKIRIYINDVPLLEVDDETFHDGHFGPYANKEWVDFRNISFVSFPDPDLMPNIALVDQPVEYETTWSDPEDDPEIQDLTNWRYVHVNPNKFLNAGDGKSGTSTWHNKTVTSPVLSFDKTGLYQIYYQGTDDPHPEHLYPDEQFNEYRKKSDEYWQNVIVHRRPIARFSLSISPADHTVVWNDTSYDPDRWLSSSNYSTEPTGINYRETRGIVERRYFNLSPSGQVSHNKLVAPPEAGTYTVGLSVKDEYGSWSDWVTRQINITVPVIDQPPVPGFTVTPATGHRGTEFRITSTAYDPEDGPAANLQHAYYIRNVTEGGIETLQSTNRGTWTKTFNSLGTMEIRQVVTDSKGATAQITRTVTVTNRAPVAQFSWSPQPVWEGDLVTFHNASFDPDGDPLTHLWHIRDDAGRLLHTTTYTGTSFRFETPGAHTVILQVSDGLASHQVTRTIQVLPLILEADVAHTPEWLAYHQERGHRTAASPKQFYSGEWIMLSARHAEAPVEWVTARLDATGRDGNPLSVETTLSAAEEAGRMGGILYDERFSSMTEGLPRGEYDIVFRIRYVNGVEKTAVVPIEIIGHVQETVQVHRLR